MARPAASEAAIVERVVAALRAAGFTCVVKTHGNQFQKGVPDLWAFHPIRGHRWIEVKRPGRRGHKSCFEPNQVRRFSQWAAAGVDVHVLCDADLSALYRPGNWAEWLDDEAYTRFERRRALLAPSGPAWTRLEDWA